MFIYVLLNHRNKDTQTEMLKAANFVEIHYKIYFISIFIIVNYSIYECFYIIYILVLCWGFCWSLSYLNYTYNNSNNNDNIYNNNNNNNDKCMCYYLK